MLARVVTRVLGAVVVAIGAAACTTGQLAFDHVRVPIAGTNVTLTGRIASEPFAIDVTGYTRRWVVGGLELSNVVVTVRDRGDAVQACVAGDAFGSRLLACGSLPRSLERLQQLHEVAVTWRLDGAGPTGHGTGRVAWGGDHAIRLERGHFDLALPKQLAGASLSGATIIGELSGTLAPLDLEVSAHGHAATLVRSSTHVRELEVPLELRAKQTLAGLEITPRGPIVARAEDATIDVASSPVSFVAPTLVVHDARPFELAELSGERHELAWAAIAGAPVDLGAGTATLRALPDGVRVERARGVTHEATLVLDPCDIRAGSAFASMLHVRGLALARLLEPAHGELEGTGVLDADVAFAHDGSGFSLVQAAVRARGRGELRFRDLTSKKELGDVVRSLAVHRRVAATLSDFAYDRLELRVRPVGRGPESTLVLHGRGNQIAQELDLVINLHGVRKTARWLMARLDR